MEAYPKFIERNNKIKNYMAEFKFYKKKIQKVRGILTVKNRLIFLSYFC